MADFFGSIVILTVGTACLVYMMSGIAVWAGLFLVPTALPSGHWGQASRAGGVILGGTVLVLMAIILLAGHLPAPAALPAATLAGVIGMIADARPLSRRAIPFVNLGLATAAVALVGPITVFPLPSGSEVQLPDALGTLFAIGFIASILTLFARTEEVRGLASGAGLIGLCLLTLLCGPQFGTLTLLMALTASGVFGLTVRNIWSGTIRLGMSGSLGLGMLVSAGAIEITHQTEAAFTPYLLGLALLPMLVDRLYMGARRFGIGAVRYVTRQELSADARSAGLRSQEIAALSMVLCMIASGLAGYALLGSVNTLGFYLGVIFGVALIGISVLTLLLAGEETQVVLSAEPMARSSSVPRKSPTGKTASDEAAASA
ncbi:hypothetical protein PB2503_09814 [Parvularcula bermudensis HTCC2503]|uniref:Uncharacterized protein n=1 Tax=Parvularcula bermudensis (strain ATCC BAA-594 / HTCC2503 / KCTC 12087) TaxID=314260 RepID=E0TDU9_PARBH|nr:hypothetical protein [Parvularcula bermudensis]ADM10015.1 hypothetical protein PB2503_09814 [Parvularcula bermudensis HTCC2503]